ncbi:hypothetical protein [Lysobacter antibioticus]|uniref:hypothetical protein n=1 Tax=Lysobacter antibioticus TaxID=84531 RepID=UPI000AF5B8AE|nr:hypothetical protein [Lysobacter antibioticus]
MKRSAKSFATLLFLCSTGAQAETTLGRLELRWGDPAVSNSPQVAEHRLLVTLVTDQGLRVAIDPNSALAGAEDLYSLAGKRVAIEFSASPPKTNGLRMAGAIVPLNSAIDEKISGTTTWVTLMCKFQDNSNEPKSLAFFQSQYGTAPGQLDHYWRQVSYNKIDLIGSKAYGWLYLPRPRSAYIRANGSANLDQLFYDCTNAANSAVNFAANGGVQGINMMFNSDLDGYAWGGGKCATLDGIYKCWSTTWNPPWSFNNLAPLAHEMGHGYGLPHANNSDGDRDPYDNPWDVMSDPWNNAVSDSTYGRRPKHLSTYSRARLAWVDSARRITLAAGSYRLNIGLDRASLSGSGNAQMILVTLPGQPSSRYYTIEARKRGGEYESNLAGDAVIIHRVDTQASTPAFSVDADIPPANRSNNEGSMFKPGEIWTAPDGAFRVHVQAATPEGFLVSVCGPKPTGSDPCFASRITRMK